MSAEETYVLAHTARCKLQIAADRPDRDLRFVLGHAITLDKLMLQIVEIERQEITRSKPKSGPRRISFKENGARPSGLRQEVPAPEQRRRGHSPPPVSMPDGSSDDDDDPFDDDDDDDDEEGGLGLQRFASAAAQPPRMIADEDDEDDDEPISPPSLPSEADLRIITQGDGDDSMVGFYDSIRQCPCSGSHAKAPEISTIWEVPEPQGKAMDSGRRTAVMAVKA